MPTIKERVEQQVYQTPGKTDRELTTILLGAHVRQQRVNQAAKKLAKERRIVRRRRLVDNLIGNFPPNSGGGVPDGDRKPSVSMLLEQRSSLMPVSNAHAGSSFENRIQEVFTKKHKMKLQQQHQLNIGINGTKPHAFDLVEGDKKVIIECKHHRWTKGGNVPSAKLTVWNEAMFYFYVAPKGYRKILCVLRDYSLKRRETLAQYYIRTYGHLIPNDVEIWEYDEPKRELLQLR